MDRHEIERLLEEIREEMSPWWTDTEAEEVHRCCDRILAIADGAIADQGEEPIEE